MAQLSITPESPIHIPEDAPPAQVISILENACHKNPGAAVSFTLMFYNERRKYKELAEERARQLELIADAPWTPAIVILMLSEDCALVAMGGRHLGVRISSDVDRAALTPGCGVLLNREQNLIVALNPSAPHAGAVGRFSRRHAGQVVIRAQSEEEFVVHLPALLRDAEFVNGDLLLYDRDSLMVLDRLATHHTHAQLLEEIGGDLRIHQLGALDEIFQDILEDLLIGFLHTDVASRLQLDPVRSITLIGPPGVGKTSLMKCIANELLAAAGVRARVLLARPSIHRSKWYGESEEKVRAMFDEVKRAARESGDFILLFFDDADQIGSRNAINDVDARVLPTFLHEVESLRQFERVILVAATNKPEAVDPALARAGRFGDREYRLPRPGTRAASGQILRCYLNGGVPCRRDGQESDAAAVIEDALSAMYAPNGELATLATLFFRDGSSRPVTPSMAVSGSLLKNAAQAAKQRACRRVLRGGLEGVTPGDLVGALAGEFSNFTQRLKPGPALQSILELPPDLDVVRVEAAANENHGRHEFLRGQAAV